MTTSKPLTIWVDEDYMTHPVVAEWIESGHIVKSIDTSGNLDYTPDLIMSRRAWQCTPSMLDEYGDVMLKKAREVKYAEPKEKAPKQSKAPRKPRATKRAME